MTALERVVRRRRLLVGMAAGVAAVVGAGLWRRRTPDPRRGWRGFRRVKPWSDAVLDVGDDLAG